MPHTLVGGDVRGGCRGGGIAIPQPRTQRTRARIHTENATSGGGGRMLLWLRIENILFLFLL